MLQNGSTDPPAAIMILSTPPGWDSTNSVICGGKTHQTRIRPARRAATGPVRGAHIVYAAPKSHPNLTLEGAVLGHLLGGEGGEVVHPVRAPLRFRRGGEDRGGRIGLIGAHPRHVQRCSQRGAHERAAGEEAAVSVGFTRCRRSPGCQTPRTPSLHPGGPSEARCAREMPCRLHGSEIEPSPPLLAVGRNKACRNSFAPLPVPSCVPHGDRSPPCRTVVSSYVPRLFCLPAGRS